MKRSFTRQFYLAYFHATQAVSWLKCPNAVQRQKMLEELMQWEVTSPISTLNNSDCSTAASE
ncbi:glucose uptake inhibitor SgrT [Yokenella regensburgei]|uniref:glucose uptake inhibitor SgrT n=1 Tax=Yokenella regensburgei TaxID=158877 RepID=UPI003F144BCC